VHDGPLRGGFLPAALGFLSRQLDDLRHADVAMQRPVHDKNTAPDDVAGLADALHGAATEAEVHAGLALRARPFPSADEVRRRGGTADEQHPDILLVILLPPAQI